MRKYLLFLFSLLAWNVISHAADGTVLVIDKIAPKNGAFVGVVDSSQTLTNTTSFNNNLSAADNTVQKALDTLDNMTISGGGASTLAVKLNAVSISSPTAVLNFVSPMLVTLAGATTAQVTVDTTSASGLITNSSATATFQPIGSYLTTSSATANYLTLSSATATYFNKSSVYVASVTGNAAITISGTNNVSAAAPLFSLNSSSVTLKGNTFNTGSNLLQLSGGLVPNSLVDGSSVTKQGLLVAGSNITLTPGAGTLTIAATSGGGGGASALEVFNNFNSARSSPTASIGMSNAFAGSVTASTFTFALNSSSVTLYGPNIPAASISAGSLGSSVIASSIAVNAVQDASIVGVSGSKITGTGTIPNAAISGSSITKAGVLVAGTNITLTPGSGITTISASGGGSGSSIYPATSTALFPSGLHVSTISLTDTQGGSNKARVYYNDFGAGGSEIHLNMDTGPSSPSEQLVIGSTNTSNKNIVFNGVNTGIAGFNDGNETLTWNKNLDVDQTLNVDGSVTFGSGPGFEFDNSVSSVNISGRIGVSSITIRNGYAVEYDPTLENFPVRIINNGPSGEAHISFMGLDSSSTEDYQSAILSTFESNTSGSERGRLDFMLRNGADWNFPLSMITQSDGTTGLFLDAYFSTGFRIGKQQISPLSIVFDGNTNDGTILWKNTEGFFDFDSPIKTSSATITGRLQANSLLVDGLTAGECIQTTTGGLLSTTGAPCGSGGGGSTIWSKLDGSALDNAVSTINVIAPLTASSSPSGQINIGVLSSSVTLQGNTFNTGSNLVQLSGGLIPNSLISGSSVTKQGVITAGTGISVTNGSGIVTIAATGGSGGITGSTTTISLTIDGQGSAIVAGSTRAVTVPYTCTISSWSVVGDVSGSLAVHLATSTFNNYPTITNITGGGNGPSLSSQSRRGAAVSGWTQTTIDAGSVLAFVVDSASTVKWATIVLWVIR